MTPLGFEPANGQLYFHRRLQSNRENTKHLDRNHTVFGKVYDGLDIIDQIRTDDTIEKIVVKEEV